MINNQQSKIDWNAYAERRLLSRNRLLFPEHRLTTLQFINYFKDIDIDLSILDAGCGDGFWIEILRNLGFENLFGVDISHPFLKRAKKKGFNVAQYDISNMFFLRKFDIVIMCDVLEHLSDINSALACVHFALKNDGIFYLMVPVYDSLSSKFNRLIHRKRKIDEAKEHDETHLHAFSKHDLTNILESNHFNIIKSIYTANRLPFITSRIQQFTFRNRFGNWLSIISRKVIA